jgi:hypothetical protein
MKRKRNETIEKEKAIQTKNNRSPNPKTSFNNGCCNFNLA